MNSVLFVCLGNICRSPLAEGVFRHLVEEHGLANNYLIDSCGTGAWHAGEKPHSGSIQIAKDNGVSIEDQRARQVEDDDFFNFKLLVAMDQSNLADLESICVNPEAELVLLRSFDPEKTELDVPDPYYEGGFDKVYRMVYRCCEQLLYSLEPALRRN